ncbi:hypothetical protein DH2020_006382 [Rehmannia glutinosa]|uniref:Pentatricopeptide repeat-containing protein n=1 Tax=Rehmannia glutinosa TaxID=99300 RepID=A0ABR0XJ47_REHGL
MEGTLFPNRPAFPVQQTKPASHPNHQRLKFNTSNLNLPPLLPLQQQQSSNSHSFPLDSLLQHLLHISSPVKSSLTSSHVIPSHDQDSLSAHFRKDDKVQFQSQELVWTMKGCLIFFLSSFELLQEVDLFSLLKGLDVSGSSEKAILLFEWVVLNLDVSNSDKLDNQIIELMVKILGRESQHSVTSKLFDVIPYEGFKLDVRAWTTILHAYSRSGKYEKAIALFKFMKVREVRPTLVTYNVMLDVYGKMGRSWDKILQLLDEMRSVGLEFDEFTCSTVISACGREGLLEEAKVSSMDLTGIYNEALSVLKEMEENNCPPDSVTYNELVAAYVRAGFNEEGAELIDTMTRKGIKPNAVTYTTLIDAYGKSGKVDKALCFFKQMKESGCVPNICTYNSILGMLGKKSRIEDMMEIISDMKSNGCTPNRVTWNTMLAMCGNRGMQKYVNRVFHEMKNCGFEPDRDTFNTLISAYGRCGSEINAGKMHDEMVKAGFSPCITTYNALLNALSRRGDWRAAESVILDMRNKGFKPNETTYSLMLHSYSKGGNIRGIERIAKEIYDGRIFPSWMLLRTLIIANFKCRSLLECTSARTEMLHIMRENDLQPDLVTYNSLMDMYARAGDCWKAQEVLNGLLESDGKPDLVSYNTVIKGFCRQGLMQEAMRTFTEMTARGIRPCIVTYNTFVAGFSGRGFFDEVNEVISYMIQHDCRPNELTYNTVVDGYCKAKNIKMLWILCQELRTRILCTVNKLCKGL